MQLRVAACGVSAADMFFQLLLSCCWCVRCWAIVLCPSQCSYVLLHQPQRQQPRHQAQSDASVAGHLLLAGWEVLVLQQHVAAAASLHC